MLELNKYTINKREIWKSKCFGQVSNGLYATRNLGIGHFSLGFQKMSVFLSIYIVVLGCFVLLEQPYYTPQADLELLSSSDPQASDSSSTGIVVTHHHASLLSIYINQQAHYQIIYLTGPNGVKKGQRSVLSRFPICVSKHMQEIMNPLWEQLNRLPFKSISFFSVPFMCPLCAPQSPDPTTSHLFTYFPHLTGFFETQGPRTLTNAQ